MKVGRAFVCVYFFVIMTILGCSQSRDWDQITFMVTDLSGDSKTAIVFKGENVTQHEDYIKLEEGQGRDIQRWTIFPQYAIEDNQYIYIPLAESGGGTGIFFELQVIDKKTLTTADYALLGDRVQIKNISILDDNTIAVKYEERSLYGEPGNIVTKHYKMHEGKLQSVDF